MNLQPPKRVLKNVQNSWQAKPPAPPGRSNTFQTKVGQAEDFPDRVRRSSFFPYGWNINAGAVVSALLTAAEADVYLQVDAG